MPIEEDFNSNVWLVLQKIKKYYYQNTNTLNIKYLIYLFPINSNKLSSEEECSILKTLEQKGVLQIFKRKIVNCTCINIHLKILQPYFYKLYQEYFFYYQNNGLQTDSNIKKASYPVNHNKKDNTNFTSYLLRQELIILDIILKNYLRSDVINQKDYKCLITINRVLKKITYENIGNRIIDTTEKKNYQDKKKRNRNNRYKEHNKLHNQDRKVQSSLDKNVINKGENNEVKNRLPLPITGKIEVHGLTEGLKDLKTLRTKEVNTNGPKFPYKITSGTHWNNVIIKFINEEEVEIQVKKLKLITDFKEMGMIGKGKIPNPSEQWAFLKVLAKCNGEITIRDQEAKDKYKKQKQALTEILQNYFSIDYDPFYPYKSCPEKGGNSYKIKLLLIPPPVSNKIIKEENPDPLGIQEYLSSQIVNK